MKVVMFDVPDEVAARLMNELIDSATLVSAPSKPATQGVTAGMGDTSRVQAPRSPPAGFIEMAGLANHPWFQEWAEHMAPKPMVESMGGDSLRLAQRFLGEVVLKGQDTWGEEQDKALASVVSAFKAWCESKGRQLD